MVDERRGILRSPKTRICQQGGDSTTVARPGLENRSKNQETDQRELRFGGVPFFNVWYSLFYVRYSFFNVRYSAKSAPTVVGCRRLSPGDSRAMADVRLPD